MLDVYLQKEKSSPVSGGSQKLVLQFEDNGYYWFLRPLFEKLAQETNQMIDLYGSAYFSAKSLNYLGETINKARKALSKRANVWEELIGTISHKDENKDADKVEKRYSTVNKKKLESMLDQLEKAVFEAREKNLGIFFFGD